MKADDQRAEAEGPSQRGGPWRLQTHPNIKHTASISNGLCVSVWVGAAAAHVEADTDHMEAQLLGPLQKSSAGL